MFYQKVGVFVYEFKSREIFLSALNKFYIIITVFSYVACLRIMYFIWHWYFQEIKHDRFSIASSYSLYVATYSRQKQYFAILFKQLKLKLLFLMNILLFNDSFLFFFIASSSWTHFTFHYNINLNGFIWNCLKTKIKMFIFMKYWDFFF